MNNLNDTKSSQKVFLLALLGILLVGLPLTVLMLQQQQIFKPFAWYTSQTATAGCSPSTNKASIQVNFTNSESTKAMDVVAKDIQTGKSVDLGTVKAKQTVSNTIETDTNTLKAGSILFTLKWTDGSSGIDTRSAQYDALAECATEEAPPPAEPFCPNNPEINEGKCTWDKLEDATGYKVTIKKTSTGDIIKSETLSEDKTEIVFPMTPNENYSCTVSPINACGNGEEAKEDKACSPTSPTPTSPPFCPVAPNKPGECSWDILDGADEYHVVIKEEGSDKIVKEETVKNPTQKINFTAEPDKKYICTVIGKNECGESTPKDSPPISCVETTPTPQPSNTPVPSATPLPTATPQPTPTPSPTPTAPPTPTMPPKPTPTPIIIVRNPPNVAPPVVYQQPQQVVQQPPQVIQQPPQVVQQPPQVIQQPPQVVQQPPQVVQPGTPAPTIKPTGNLSNSLLLIGTSSILLIIGSVLFFLL